MTAPRLAPDRGRATHLPTVAQPGSQLWDQLVGEHVDERVVEQFPAAGRPFGGAHEYRGGQWYATGENEPIQDRREPHDVHELGAVEYDQGPHVRTLAPRTFG